MCLRENEIAILRTKSNNKSKMWSQIITKRSSQELMNWVGLKQTLERLASTNKVQWREYLLKRG